MVAADDITAGAGYEYAFDNLGRVTRVDIDNGGPVVSLIAAYNAAGLGHQVVEVRSARGIKEKIGAVPNGTADYYVIVQQGVAIFSCSLNFFRG